MTGKQPTRPAAEHTSAEAGSHPLKPAAHLEPLRIDLGEVGVTGGLGLDQGVVDRLAAGVGHGLRVHLPATDDKDGLHVRELVGCEPLEGGVQRPGVEDLLLLAGQEGSPRCTSMVGGCGENTFTSSSLMGPSCTSRSHKRGDRAELRPPAAFLAFLWNSSVSVGSGLRERTTLTRSLRGLRKRGKTSV